MPPESIKDSFSLGIPLPQFFVMPPDRLCREVRAYPVAARVALAGRNVLVRSEGFSSPTLSRNRGRSVGRFRRA